MGEIPLLSNPSTNSMQLRLIVLSWIVNDNVTSTHVLVPHKHISSNNEVSVYADSDDDFVPTVHDKSSKLPSNDSESGDELMKFDQVGRSQILSMLPNGYTYKIVMYHTF